MENVHFYFPLFDHFYIDIYIDFISEIDIKDNDMCVLLANLLDNAIEACEKVEEERRLIYLRIKRQNQMLLIFIKNAIQERETEKREFFKTSKKNKELHGLGIKCIDNVIQKYDGHKEYSIQKDNFELYISLPLD